MEKKVKIKTSDAHTIYGILNTKEVKSDVLTIFVHGLTGSLNGHTFFNASKFFPKNGIDVFRFSLYSGKKDGRKLSECTISTHSDDLNKVVSYFRKKYKFLAIVGHSLGSPTILKSNTSKTDVIVLWDPSYLKDNRFKLCEKIKVKGKEFYLLNFGTEFLLNPKMFKEWEEFNGLNELPLVAKLGKPLRIIAAGKGVLKKGSRKYISSAEKPADLVIIKKASHNFSEEGVEDVLLKNTLEWIKKYTIENT